MKINPEEMYEFVQTYGEEAVKSRKRLADGTIQLDKDEVESAANKQKQLLENAIEYEKQQNEIQKQKLKTKLKQLEKMADMDVEDANDRVKIEEMVSS